MPLYNVINNAHLNGNHEVHKEEPVYVPQKKMDFSYNYNYQNGVWTTRKFCPQIALSFGFTFILILMGLSSFAQSTLYRFRYTIDSRQAFEIIKGGSTTSKDVRILKGATLEFTKKVNNGKEEFTIKKSLILKNDSIVRNITAKDSAKASEATGYAFIKQVKDTLHINAWNNNTFSKEKKYFIKLQNRGIPQKFKFNVIEVTALTIPFKYVFKVKNRKKNLEAPTDFLANINIGAYIGYTWGKHKFFYLKNEEDRSPRANVVQSVGLFMTFGTTKLDSAATSLSDEPITYDKNIGLISPGGGYHIAIAGIKMGLYLGFDFTLGSTGRKWNYANRPWIGIGFGYNLGVLSSFK